MTSDARRQPPATETERVIAGIWCEVLELPEVGVLDNFFDLGGHSVLLHMVLERIAELLGKRPPIVELFQYPTVRALAHHLDIGEADAAGSLARTGGRGRLGQMRAHRVRRLAG